MIPFEKNKRLLKVHFATFEDQFHLKKLFLIKVYKPIFAHDLNSHFVNFSFYNKLA